jgi:hypothetical protein
MNNGKKPQSKTLKKKSNGAPECLSQTAKGGHVQVLCDELVIKLEEVDKMIRDEIRREIGSTSRDTLASSRLACLMRSRADVQSAITCLLGASH